MTHKRASRAIIVNLQREVYLVVHNYVNPRNAGKWSTVGGRRDASDRDDLGCLRREIAEEFGADVLENCRIVSEIGSILKDQVRHIFFAVEFFGDTLKPLHTDEVLKGEFMALEAAEELGRVGKLFFGTEYSMAAKAIQELSELPPSSPF